MDSTFKNYLKTRNTLFEERFNQAVEYLNSINTIHALLLTPLRTNQ